MKFYRVQTVIAICLLLISGTGCKSSDQEKAVQADQPSAPAVSQQQAPEKEYGPGLDIKGKVLETMDVGGYTYVQVADDEGPTWVAIPQSKVELDQEVTVTQGMEMRNFESKTLNRTFDKIYFSAGFDGEAAAQADPHAGVPGAPEIGSSAQGGSFDEALQAEGAGGGPTMVDPSELTGGSMAAKAPAADVQVEKAEGENAYTVGEIFAKGKELDNQKVTVRGQVVKVSSMIMGKNWLHIQDGTGDAADNSNDLVVTTMAEPAKDSVVVIEGTLHADRDFGAGYRYDVIIEDAEIK
ncbi:MAG: DNA-binding protein [Desulfobulbaceae bacterium]|nr:DNA-binding protein [Desulfobulbaceae bacterium]